jgi:uncharacterized protein with HEPN domain
MYWSILDSIGIPKLYPELNVTDQKKIIGLRHILVHDYDLIDDGTIWKIAHQH